MRLLRISSGFCGIWLFILRVKPFLSAIISLLLFDRIQDTENIDLFCRLA